MYRINYITDIVRKNKTEIYFIKFCKILNLFVQLTIIFLLVSSVYLYNKINEYNENIKQIKQSIEEKRQSNNMDAVEKEWNGYYFKLTAMKEQLSKNTNYGLIFKELGNFLPSDDFITTAAANDTNMLINLNLGKNKLKELKNVYDYENVLKMAFDRSVYFDKNIKIELLYEDKIDNKLINLLKVNMPIYSRK
ncbi:MAG: hypothetical protein WCS83_03700 [Endomicrobiia bacterium]|nr:hypothetical protein [Endomicrobiaceae bacterium]MDD3053394.1 hypothetical protein [Endomicrobiaceae bacterium]MDD3922424.1 hypothetical protein [Endomicrobiaceae bacterium]MDD5102387.1 hypothetical protein [Endomicrobiaceae bacterium]